METVPPVPYKTPITNKSGILHPLWSAWFRQLFARIGGPIALTNVELENIAEINLTDVEADIAVIQGQISTLQSTTATHTTQINDLGQGPNL